MTTKSWIKLRIFEFVVVGVQKTKKIAPLLYGDFSKIVGFPPKSSILIGFSMK